MLKLLLQLIFISTFSLAYLTNEATINVENNTHIEGSTIASGTIDENGNLIQNDNLELNTNTLTYKHLSNTTVSKGNSAGGGYSGNGDNVNANFSQDITYEKTKTLATTNAKVNVEDTKNSDDLSRINTDTANTNKDIFSAQSSVEVDLKVDTRMLSEDGRKQIKDDIVTSKTMVDAVEQIIETDKAGIQDFFAETQKNIDVYEGMKEEIRNNPTLAQQLANPNLSPEQKQQMLQSVANTVKESLGYKTKKDDVKLVSTDKKGANDTQFKGHYNSDGKGNGDKNTYINDKNNKDTQDLLTTIGHETQHNMDEQKQIYKQNDKDQNTYATNFGEDVASYTDAALDIVANKDLATTNNQNSGQVTQTPSIFNDNTMVNNSKHFNDNVDVSMGDDLTVFVHGTYSSPAGADRDFIDAVSKTYGEKVYQFDWSGEGGTANGTGADNKRESRENAAVRLTEYVENYQFKDGEKLNVIGHSHGGNVLKDFTQMYEGDKKIDNATFMGTPVRNDHVIDYNKFEDSSKIQNVYDSSDLVQRLGGTDTPKVDTNKPNVLIDVTFGNVDIAKQKINNENVENIKVEVPNKNFYDEPFGDHSNMDSKEVWEKIKNESK
jgi:hypothetical protein